MTNFSYSINRERGICHIIDSYTVTKTSDMRDFIVDVLSEEPFTCRSVNSYVREWKAHNLLYRLGLFKSHTQDVDLDIQETRLRRFCYFILSLFYF